MKNPIPPSREEEHLESSDLLKDIVIGMSDGLTVPFALAAGLSGAVNNSHLIIIAGLAEIAAGSIAMGMGGYLAGKTEQDHYMHELKREYKEVDTVPHMERAEVQQIFKDWELSPAVQQAATDEICSNKHVWVNFMMKHELGLKKPDTRRARKSAINIAAAYILGGLIPLSPYFFTDTPLTGLEISASLTLLCLFIFGYFKSKVTGVNAWWGGFKIMLIGALAASAAFFLARLIDESAVLH